MGIKDSVPSPGRATASNHKVSVCISNVYPIRYGPEQMNRVEALWHNHGGSQADYDKMALLQ